MKHATIRLRLRITLAAAVCPVKKPWTVRIIHTILSNCKRFLLSFSIINELLILDEPHSTHPTYQQQISNPPLNNDSN